MTRIVVFRAVTVLMVWSATASAVPVHLRCEYLANPLGIDRAAPHLSWQSDDSERNWTLHAVTLTVNDPGAAVANMFGAAPSIAEVQASDDGQTFRKLAEIPNDGGEEHTIAFPATAARFFRVAFSDKPPSGLSCSPESFAASSSLASSKRSLVGQLHLHSKPDSGEA